MKLVQKSLTALFCALIAALPQLAFTQEPAESQEYLPFYNPAKGFKPAQADLTEIFLQLAGSLEANASPEPYIRHVLTEQQRISKRYEARNGKPLPNHLPAYMTAEYVDQFIANWKLLEPKLKLDNLSRDAGLCVRQAIRGAQGSGTMLVPIFDRHRQLVTESLQTTEPKVGFRQLRYILNIELNLGKIGKDPSLAGIVKREPSLSEAERKEFAALIARERFTKADFPSLERFYGGPYDKLSEDGKDELSQRVWGGVFGTLSDARTASSRKEVVKYCRLLQQRFEELYAALDASLKAAQAQQIKAVISSVVIDIGALAQAELELGIIAASLK